MTRLVTDGPGGLLKKLWESAYLLLGLTVLFWAGNAIVGRAAHGVVPPMALAFWRWLMAWLVVMPMSWPHLRRDWPELLRRWKIVVLLGVTGVASFGAFLYWGLQFTTAVNGVLLQSAIPPMVLLAAFVLFRERAGLGQMAGVALSLGGVLVIITEGHPLRVAQLALNIGDGAVLCGVALYAIYAPLLRLRPKVHPLSLLASTFAVAAVAILPFYVAELASGRLMTATPGAFLAIAFVAILPSVASYLFFNRGVELIGAARAGQFTHLMPIFGAILAVLLLHEPLHLFHLFGLALIGAGILAASLRAGSAKSVAVAD